jgi:hypothetical protein
MSIGVNNPQVVTSESDVSSATLSAYVVGTEADRILCVVVSWYQTSEVLITSVKFNTSETMTSGVYLNDEKSGVDNNHIEIFYLLDPSNATADIDVVWAGTIDDFTIHAFYLDGAKQQAPEASASDALDLADPLDHSITTVTANAMIAAGLFTEPNGQPMTGLVAESGTTGDTAVLQESIFDAWSAMGHRLGGAAGSYSVGWSMTGQNDGYNVVQAALAFEEAGAPAGQNVPEKYHHYQQIKN